MYYKITLILLIAVLASAAWWSVQLARADAYFRQQTPDALERAITLTPQNTAYLAMRALQNEYEGQDSQEQLKRIVHLNPRLAAPRIRLGLAAELRGDGAEAERWLLEAAAVDRQFETRWTLANFYFRQDRDAFWTWMQSALEISYGDRKPLFELCWRKSSNPRATPWRSA